MHILNVRCQCTYSMFERTVIALGPNSSSAPAALWQSAITFNQTQQKIYNTNLEEERYLVIWNMTIIKDGCWTG